MRSRIWLTHRLLPDVMARLEADADVIVSADGEGLDPVDAAIVGVKITFDGPCLDRLGPRLKVVARTGMGLDNIVVPAATERGILVTNTPDAPTESTAEHAVALLLSLSKRVVVGDRSLRGASVVPADLMGTELRGRVLGVVGLGRIGRRVAEICGKGLGMRVAAYDPYVEAGVANSLGVEMIGSLEALLSQADVVTLHTSLTPETQHLIGEQELRWMKPGAYLINVSRGGVVDEGALVQVLQEGHLAGAGLDVFASEPPAPDNPLLNLPGVPIVATPHMGSRTRRGVRAMHEGAADQVLQILRGERPDFLVNPEVWPGRMTPGVS